MNKLAPIIGLRRHHRANGEPYMAGVVDERLVLEPGDRLDLRRLHDGHLPTPEFALLIVRSAETSKGALRQAHADRLDGSAIRRDPRDETTP